MSICQLAHPVIVRSPHAHARIVSVNKSAALASTGVLGEQGGMAATVKEHDLGQVKAPVQHNLVDVSRPLRLRNAGKHDVERKILALAP
jgi:CO/xanthine dehydrogenase Mo-binding subunit